MLGNGFIPEHVGIAQVPLILFQGLLPSLLPPLPADRIQLEDLYVAGDNRHFVDPIQHILQLLPPHQPLIVGQLRNILLYPLRLFLVELTEDQIDILSVGFLVDKRHVLEDPCEPREMILKVVLALDLLC